MFYLFWFSIADQYWGEKSKLLSIIAWHTGMEVVIVLIFFTHCHSICSNPISSVIFVVNTVAIIVITHRLYRIQANISSQTQLCTPKYCTYVRVHVHSWVYESLRQKRGNIRAEVS